MIQTLEALGDVALDEPLCSSMRRLKLLQSRMTSSSRSESLGQVTELGFVVCLQQQSDDFLEELGLPGGQAKRASGLASALAHGSPSHGCPLEALGFESVEERGHLIRGHAIGGLGSRAWGERSRGGM